MTFNPQKEHNPPKDPEAFELLCCDLWKTIWNDPNAQRVGRRGQAQHGVDIVGRPHGARDLIGIQCKCKETFTGQQVTEKELLVEVEKAKGFEPRLTTFILATTAPRHGPIQCVARQLTKDHYELGLFDVHVYAWQDIDELLIAHRPHLARQVYSDLADDPLRQDVADMVLLMQTLKMTALGILPPRTAASSSDMSFVEALKDAASKSSDRVAPVTGWKKTTGAVDNRPVGKILACDREDIINPAGPTDDSDAGQLTMSLETSLCGEVVDFVGMTLQAQRELSVWNYEKAAKLANELEGALSPRTSIDVSVLPNVLILLARIRVNFLETKPFEEESFERASSLLMHVEAIASNVEHLDEIAALRAALISVKDGSDAALLLLDGKTDPYAIRTRIALLLNKQRFAEALAVIDGFELHERWCDVAVLVYALNDKIEKASALVRWAAGLPDRNRYFQCCVRFAEAMFSRAITENPKGAEVFPASITASERENLAPVLVAVEPVLAMIRVYGGSTSELDMAALHIAWKANYLLQNRQAVESLLTLMLHWTPVPLDVAVSIINGYFKTPDDLTGRIRKDHPNDLDAGIMATIIDIRTSGRCSERLTEAKKLLPLADTSCKKEKLFHLFREIWPDLESPEIEECEAISKTLLGDNAKLRTILDASIALRLHDADKAIHILDKQKDERDIYWLQVRANACLLKGQLPEAVEFLRSAVKLTLNEGLLSKTGDIAFKAGKYDVAVWCYEKLVESNPDNVTAHSNLAHIYTFILHDLENAAIQFQALRRIEPANSTYTINLAICLAQLFRPEESLALYNELCEQVSPSLPDVLARAQLHHSMGHPGDALASLNLFRECFWEDPTFVMVYMNTAHAAGKDDVAHDALMALNRTQDDGAIPEEVFRAVDGDEILEMVKHSAKQAQDRNEHLHTEMLKGRLPWVWAEQMSNNAIYWGWRTRTQKLDWIGNDPMNLARYCIYSTNGFHAQDTDEGHLALLPLACPPSGTKVVADVSALITLHRLGLLTVVVEYFGEVLVPAGYLPTVLEDSRQMVLSQRSQQLNAEQLIRQINAERLVVLAETAETPQGTAVVDEYSESAEHRYRLVDITQPLYAAEILSDADLARVSRVSAKLSAVDPEHPPLAQFQDIIVDLMTLETIAQSGLLDAVTGFFKVHITTQTNRQVIQNLNAIAYQEETRGWHMGLWNTIRSDKRFKFVSHTVPIERSIKDKEVKDYIPFLSNFVAQEVEIPLLADDRVCQAFMFNGAKRVSNAAFGSDVLILALHAGGKLDAPQAANAFQQLMSWRYRFVIPSAEILKVLADNNRGNPPGRSLRGVAEYVHDCMRDPGLFGGAEKTELGDSMATRAYLTWNAVIAEFLVLVWADESFTLEAATRLTAWCCDELLPSCPMVVGGCLTVRISELALQTFLSHTLVNMANRPEKLRMEGAMKVLQEVLRLADDEYQRIILEVLTGIARTADDTEELGEMFRRMQIRMMSNAMSSFDRIGLRTMTALEDLGLCDNQDEDPFGANVDLEVLRDPSHPRLLTFALGPLLLYLTADEKPLPMVVEVSALLYSGLSDVRKAALAYLERLIAGGSLEVTPKTKDVFKKTESKLASETSSEWRSAAIELVDAFDDDVLVAIQGARQSLQCNPVIKDSLNDYVQRVFYPTVSSLESIVLDIVNPDGEHPRMAEIVLEIVAAAASLNNACERYHVRLGYLPLAPLYSLGAVVIQWMDTHPDCDAWAEVWKWVHSSRSSIPSYHACSVFVQHPELIPEGKLPEFWREILLVIQDSVKEDSDDFEREPWVLRRDLARHYAFHLEAHLPDSNGANIACISWWLAEKVAALLSDTPTSAQFYRTKWIVQASDLSRQIWLAAAPSVGQSFLRYVTNTISSPWATALLALMAINLEQLAPQEQSPEIQASFTDALMICLFGSLPAASEQPVDPTYAQEYPLELTALKWAYFQSEDQRTGLEKLTAANRTLSSVEGLCEALKNLDERSPTAKVAVALVLKVKAYTDPSVAPSVWEILQDVEWRQKVLGSVDDNLLGLLVDAFTFFMVDNREKWSSLLPHYIAELCEKEENEDRRRELFLYVVHTSLASDTVSAVRRLLRGSQKEKFAQYAEEYRGQVLALWSHYPAWVQGRMRYFLANFHIQ